ncbi:NUMOD4 domain-containing protein [soil metagenome]
MSWITVDIKKFYEELCFIQIEGEFSDYLVNRKGEVFNNKNGKMRKLKPWLGTHGYSFVSFSVKGKVTKQQLHRVVADTFLINWDDKPDINHRNGIKTDNHIDNLEWVTKSENLLHSHRVLGQKTTSKKIKCVETGVVYSSAREAERILGINNANICSAIKGRKRQPRAGGFHWEYA